MLSLRNPQLADLIFRLNSTLSVRIEELNAQVSILCTENLRLRASEISLTTQLKQERDNSRRLMDDVQAAVCTTMFFH